MPAGKIQVIMGLSGSGKSTLIRHINRLIDPTSGDDHDRRARRCQDDRELNCGVPPPPDGDGVPEIWSSAASDRASTTSFGLEVRGVGAAKSRDTACAGSSASALTALRRAIPNQLSGGMQQRVGLARALTNDAPILLMDEAYSALDPLIRTDMQTVLLDLQKEMKKTIVFITHDLDEALRLGDRIAILRDGESSSRAPARHRAEPRGRIHRRFRQGSEQRSFCQIRCCDDAVGRGRRSVTS